jgi:hypothetical protein
MVGLKGLLQAIFTNCLGPGKLLSRNSVIIYCGHLQKKNDSLWIYWPCNLLPFDFMVTI